MTISTLTRYLFIITMLSACTWKGADAEDGGNDTALGDDDGGETGGNPFEEPPPIEDHGVAEYCVERARWVSANFGGPDSGVNHLDISSNEFWWHALERSYGGWLDITDKPSPAIVPNLLPPNWPLAKFYIEDAAERGGIPTGLVSGYHLQFPVPGASQLLDPGIVRLPYSVDIIAESVTPGSAFRHSEMGPGCCNYPLTDTELDSPEWEAVEIPNDVIGSSDCMAYVMTAGINGDEDGYPKSPSVSLVQNARASWCWTHDGSYNIGSGSAYEPATALAGLLDLLSQQNASIVKDQNGAQIGTAYANQLPMFFNYEWAAQLVQLADWQAIVGDALVWSGGVWLLNKFNISVQAAVTAILWIANNLYLPPDRKSVV